MKFAYSFVIEEDRVSNKPKDSTSIGSLILTGVWSIRLTEPAFAPWPANSSKHCYSTDIASTFGAPVVLSMPSELLAELVSAI
jgi:hypothetical protein